VLIVVLFSLFYIISLPCYPVCPFALEMPNSEARTAFFGVDNSTGAPLWSVGLRAARLAHLGLVEATEKPPWESGGHGG